jgi:isoquinoline 1-oxidoreductase alpha subunit
VAISFKLNGKAVNVNADGDIPLLWILREDLGLTGTKFGCGAALCGACTVHVEGQPARSCVLPAQAVRGKHVTTIEGLSATRMRVLQQQWIAHEVPQCGYCQSGALMAVAGLLTDHPEPTDAQIDAVITNVCRCGTYPRMRKAIHAAAAELAGAAA